MGADTKGIPEDLFHTVRTWPEWLKERKREGRKIVGYTGRFVPEELIHASGAVPYLICKGGDPGPVEATLPYMLRFMNPFVRAQMGYHLLGVDPVVPMLDLIVAQCDDCHMARMTDLMEYLKLPTLRIGVPNDWEKDLSFEYYRKGLVRLRRRLEDLTGSPVSDEALKEAIRSVNAVRSALEGIGGLRKRHPPPIGGYDFIRLNHASFASDIGEAVPRLRRLFEERKSGESPFSEKAPRVLVAGRVIAMGDYAVPRLIEESGGVIVAEMLDEGMRHCRWNVRTDGDPLDGLANVYFRERVPPSIFQPAWRKRLEYLQKLIQAYRVDAVVWYQLSFDEIYDMEYPILAKALEAIRVPVLRLETSYEYSREAMAPLKTRVESFVDSIRAR
jgi:benzoyl-CoA reductase/2-hydroxyglutaryl-CoA dehydratase subunit BcrC/BadD/HgdB